MADLGLKYFDPAHPGSYAGVDKFYRNQTAVNRKGVESWLRGEEAYSLHRPVRYRFPRNKVVTSGIDSQWDFDLIDLSNHRESNDGYAYVLLAVDILSHYVWIRALKTKKAVEVAKAMESIFADGRKPLSARSDRGGEFTGLTFKKMMKKAGVHHFLTNNQTKANYAERAIKTLRQRLARYFTKKQTRRWEDVLQDVVSSYNKTYHSTIKRSPASVTKDNQSWVWQTQYGEPPTKLDRHFKLEEGDLVRISHLKRAFQREYDERWTGELFKVKERSVRAGLNVYRLEDFLSEVIGGLFYGPELEKVEADPTGVFKIHEVLRRRKRRGHEAELLVSWLHWPSKFSSWIKASDMVPVT